MLIRLTLKKIYNHMQRFFSLLLILVIMLPTAAGVQAQSAQDTIVIGLPDYRWNKSSLQVQILTADNETWWRNDFVNLTLSTIEKWNDAIVFFAEKYRSYSYLSYLKLNAEVSNHSSPGFDIYLSYTNTVLIQSVDALGLTTISSLSNRTIDKALITITDHSQNSALTSSDIVDVTTHEIGHALGLEHSNSSKDLMYPYYDIYSTNNAISTIDLYGVALIFDWMSNSVKANTNQISLPSTIDFEYAPIKNPMPQTITDNPFAKFLEAMFSVYMQPMILIPVIAVVLFLIVSFALSFSKKRLERQTYKR